MTPADDDRKPLIVWTIAMSLFGIVLSRVLGSVAASAAIGRTAALVTAVASIGLGAYWVSTAV